LKRLIAILLLSVYLTPGAELHQLLKVPALVAHFVEHRAQDGKLSFWNFLYAHYAHGNVKDADYEKDMKLPFKSHEGYPNATVFVSLLPESGFPDVRMAKPVYGEAPVFPAWDEHFVHAAYLSAIWQPPRTV
jgi:hypothetical protein